MVDFHAVMISETGCEFGATVTAETRADARDLLADLYPEARCAQLESPQDRAERERRYFNA
jgi:hypothetical protein